MLVSILSLVALCLSISWSSAQSNLLVNGGFEASFTNPSDVPFWEEFPISGNTGQVYVQDYGGEDDGYCLYMGALTTLSGVYQNVSLPGNTQFPLSFSLLVSGEPQNRFRIESICAGETRELFDDRALDSTEDQFIRRTVYLRTPSSSSQVTCSIRFLGAASGFSNFLLDNVILAQPSTVGDPVFVGFHGQIYQVHGIPGRIFNIISTAHLQLNALFTFLAQGDSMNQNQMREMRARSDVVSNSKRYKTGQHVLPVTTAWSHDGTYLGSMAMQFSTHNQIIRVKIVPGAYRRGIESIEVDEKRINVENATFPLSLVQSKGVEIKMVSQHTIEVSTSEIHLVIVNSDHFFNIASARLSSQVQKNPSVVQGILGQSADGSRFFPKYEPTAQASGAEKDDWNQHQIMDYLIADDNLWSGEFALNLFEISH